MSFLLALIVAGIGVLPLLLNKKPRIIAAGITWLCFTLIGWPIIYFGLPGSVFPLFGGFGLMALVWMIIAAAVHCANENSFTSATVWPILTIIVYLGTAICNGALFRSGDMARLIGNVETREWTQDVQPKDPKHVRLVPHELAAWLANKQLGSMPGVVGSQFQIYPEDLTLQRINDELWYVAPLDFKGYKAWTVAKTSSGYVMVHGEDPRRQPVIKSGLSMTYTKHASFGDNLKRHLWQNGYRNTGLMDFSFEIDESGKPWYVVSTYRPTIGWQGRRVTGIVLINPVDGAIQPYAMGSIPSWIDRVVPTDVIADYIDKCGKYSSGWWNATWGHKNIFESETPTISYGSDGNIYWVTSVTSPNVSDQSMVGLYYTNVHTGRSVHYHATGGTEAAILTSVNNTVGYKNWHGAGPVLYNVYGTMASIVPVLGNNETFQGVALVNVSTLKVSFGETEYEAFRLYQRDLELAGQSVAPENFHDMLVIEGTIARFAPDIQGGTTVYYLTLSNSSQIFIGGSERSLELPLTKVGDMVKLTYDESTEEVVPILVFDNLELSPPSVLQRELRERVGTRQAEVTTERGAKAARDELGRMSDQELLDMMQSRQHDKK